jgi:hypothetical protein
MSQQKIPSAQTAVELEARSRVRNSGLKYVFGAFVMMTSLAFILAMPTPLRATFAEILSGLLSGPAAGWNGETVALKLASALPPAPLGR